MKNRKSRGNLRAKDSPPKMEEHQAHQVHDQRTPYDEILGADIATGEPRLWGAVGQGVQGAGALTRNRSPLIFSRIERVTCHPM